MTLEKIFLPVISLLDTIHVRVGIVALSYHTVGPSQNDTIVTYHASPLQRGASNFRRKASSGSRRIIASVAVSVGQPLTTQRNGVDVPIQYTIDNKRRGQGKYLQLCDSDDNKSWYSCGNFYNKLRKIGLPLLLQNANVVHCVTV
ncbi:hypothetical protein WN51_09327 [Melipona quadrifasciata]|uniref:Uncharacterized protein n=1 Tax=Melipona quadrifasciata TaxID=166423 RepID=A0A0N0BIH3_9HYME|nr:hypothetical protein WN51_09327 [Melipona quadrifasciata]